MSVRRLVPIALLLLALAVSACGSDDAPSGTKAGASTAAAASDALVQEGLAQLAADDTGGATATFEKVLAADPDNVYAHYNLGVIAQRSGDDAGAMEQYDAAIAADEEFAPALFNKGILTEDDDLEAAVALYRRAVAADDQMAAAYMRLGFALDYLGRTHEAEQALSRGVSLDPSMADVEAPSYD